MRSNDLILGEVLNEAEAFTKFIEAMKIASSSARQLAFMREEPAWLAVQNMLDGVVQRTAALAQAGVSRGRNRPSLRVN